MNISTHNYSPTPVSGRPLTQNQNDGPEGPKDPQESYTPSNGLATWAPVAGFAALGAGLGVYAGLADGVLPAVAGLAAGTGLGVVAAAGFARAGLDEQSGTAGIVGFFGGAAAGAAVGYAVSSPAAAVALGVTGGLGFAFFSAFSNWK